MWERRFYNCSDPHTNPDGQGPADRATAHGFCTPYSWIGENVAWGWNMMSAPEEAVDWWKNSPPHNTNMLAAQPKFIGVGYYHAKEGTSDYYMWVQLFGAD